jgi:hypothetical protein
LLVEILDFKMYGALELREGDRRFSQKNCTEKLDKKTAPVRVQLGG